MPENITIGILGASSLVGQPILSYLSQRDYHVVAFSRKKQVVNQNPLVQWSQLDELSYWKGKISHWICVAPIWVLADYFQELQACGVKRIVALSSTSIFTKQSSQDRYEQDIVNRLKKGESELIEWAETHNINWCILRPTLIYGYNRDKNIAEITRFIQRFGFFPLWGEAKGLRQPIHADDVAKACVLALQSSAVKNHAYNISGKETLSYQEMVYRIFLAMGKTPKIIRIPLFVFRFALIFLRLIPNYRHWSVGMAERMNRNLTFDYREASDDFDFSPSKFRPFFEVETYPE